jgi:transposase
VEEVFVEATAQGGQAVWIMESMTGWARVKELVQEKAKFLVCNVLQMPRPPKAKRRKTDKLDTGRTLREYLTGTLPFSFQPQPKLRRLRRLTGLRENLTSRQTALKNWIGRYLAHETWQDRQKLWTRAGTERLKRWAAGSADAFVLSIKLEELSQVEVLLDRTEEEILKVYARWPLAQCVDEIRGIGVVSAVSILARIGPVERFVNVEQLVSFAGLAPGVRQSDRTVRTGHLGGGGTDMHLRYYLVEASIWARQIPRYSKAYERVARKRGAKVGRLTVARMLLRSIYKMIRGGIRFNQLPAA